jgi:hypothetical protein
MTWSSRARATIYQDTLRVELWTTRQHHNLPLVSRDKKIMAPKTYKEMKEAWVTGHTGGSVADVNIVSFAMPVPYTSIRPRMGLD